MRTARRCWLWMLLLAGVSAMAGCKRELPPPWKEMHFPMSQAEVLPGADEKGFQANYREGTSKDNLFREYQRALEEKGWSVLKQGSSHDPGNGAFSVILKRSAERVLVNVVGTKPVQAKVTTSVD